MSEHDEAARAPYLTGNVRDDFDDEIGPLTVKAIRRRLLLPAIAIILFGVVGLLVVLGFEGYLIRLTFFAAKNRTYVSIEDFVAASAIALAGFWVMGATIAGGVGMIRLRHHGLADFAAAVFIIVTTLGVVTLMFAPLGFWAWITLNDPAVRSEFHRRRSYNGRQVPREAA